MASEKKVGFLALMVKGKLVQGLDAIISGLVQLDPETAGQAEIEQFESKLEEASIELAKARQDYNREQQEAAVARSNYDKKLKAAEILSARLEAATDDAARASIEKSLDTLMSELEDMLPDVEAEEAEAADAKAYLDELEAGVSELAGVMTNVKRQIDKAKREMQRAEAAEERAERAADQSATLAGLRGSSKVGVALNAMTQAAEASKIRADAANTRAKLLGPASVSDDNIASALAEASGETTGAPNRAERLAKLKRQPAGAAA